MVIRLYKNSSEPNKVGKTLGSELEISGTLREETDILQPEVLIEAENLSQYNYMTIPQFHRKYFIDDIAVVRTGLWRIRGRVDVLDTYETDIKKLHVILSASDSAGDDYVTGEQWKSKVKALTDILPFSSGLLNNGEYILITAGG